MGPSRPEPMLLSAAFFDRPLWDVVLFHLTHGLSRSGRSEQKMPPRSEPRSQRLKNAPRILKKGKSKRRALLVGAFALTATVRCLFFFIPTEAGNLYALKTGETDEAAAARIAARTAASAPIGADGKPVNVEDLKSKIQTRLQLMHKIAPPMDPAGRPLPSRVDK